MDGSKLKVLSLFSGLGAFEKSLTNLGIDYEVIGTSEWDVNAIISYDAIHTNDGIDYTKDMSKADILKELENFTFSTDGKNPCDTSKIKLDKLRQLYNANKRSRNMGDITKIENIPIANLWTYSSPCTSISVAGKQEGLTKDSGTASSLIWDVERLLEIAQSRNELPEYLLLENVKNLVGKQFKPEFDKWISRLEEFGYNTYWKVINSKNMGIPQNRDRCFAISIRKDIDDKQFQFPLPFDNGLRLKDFLEQNVEEKYYISKDKTEKLIAQLKEGKKGTHPNFQGEPLVTSALGSREHRGSGWQNTVGTLCARDYKDPKVVCVSDDNNQITIPCLTPDRIEKRQNGRRFKEDGDPMFTITSQDIHGVMQIGNIVDTGNFENPQRGRIYSSNGCSPSLNTCGGGGQEPKILESNIIGCIDDQGRTTKQLNINDNCPTLRAQSHGNEPKILEDFYANRDIREYDECPTLRADRQGLKVIEEDANELKFVGGIQTGEMWIDDGKELSRNYRSGNRVYDSEGIAVAQTAEGGGLAGYTGMYKVEELVKPELVGGIGDINFGKQYRQGNRVYDSEKVAMCLLSQPVGNTGGNSYLYTVNQPNYRIRKLTPCECYKLQGFSNLDFDKCKNAGVADSNLYRAAGNSITCNALMALFGELFNVEYKDKIKDIRKFYNSQIDKKV